MNTCLGDIGLQDGLCPDFKCINHSSCNGNGNCNSDQTSCECNAGFSGYDCSIDLAGEKSWVFFFIND